MLNKKIQELKENGSLYLKIKVLDNINPSQILFVDFFKDEIGKYSDIK